MTKRTNASNEVPPAKRSRRAPGFRLARPASIPSESQPSTSTSTSLFVTVNQSDERPGTLTAQNRLLASTHGPSTSTSSSPSSLEGLLPHAFEPDTEIQDEPIPQLQQPEETIKPKRKRNTTIAVRYRPDFCA